MPVRFYRQIDSRNIFELLTKKKTINVDLTERIGKTWVVET